MLASRAPAKVDPWMSQLCAAARSQNKCDVSLVLVANEAADSSTSPPHVRNLAADNIDILQTPRRTALQVQPGDTNHPR
eukprot:CAMPEP_0203906782 /NCGR_PEP_ID=MMETSP0359-20131031/48366_1 /ASSEMBLY_ACC=CAM_ASM_000338 /TAXON_ID=268821 /ORGANISM="Scrippsiella Hangoei, Strain SHTV-5" /LENGTH=78 /DNA_ID=CAMNT_0050831483 /DNA_START=131 /DNA_END=364 /DNA_ORIENTATION=+